MNMSKNLVVVLFMSIVSILMLSAAALAAPPLLSVSGIPTNVVAGTSFKATLTASNSTAGDTITSISLVNVLGWAVSPKNTVTCSSMSCVADFTVNVPSDASVGTSSLFTSQANSNTGDITVLQDSVVVAGTPAQSSATLKVDAVEIDNFELSQGVNNVRNLERGQSFAVKVKLTALADIKDVEIRAFVNGLDSSTQDISDTEGPFDVEKGVSYVKTLNLKLPDRAQEDTYRLRVIVAGRNNDDVSQSYSIKITPTAHDVIIKDLSVSQDSVQSGRAILATVRIKNLGDKTENDVKISVSIPELGVTATPDYVNTLKAEESATSEEFFLRIDSCVKPGSYDVKAVVTFQDGDQSVTATQPITVTSGGCAAATTGTTSTSSGVKIIFSPQSQDVSAGGASVSYPITISNDGTSTKSYTLSVTGADWATVRISPSNVVNVKGGDSQTFSVMVSAKGSAPAGAQTLVLRITDQSGDVVKELPLSASVVGGSAGSVTNLVQLLQLGLIALIVVLVIVGLIVAFRRMKGPDEGGEEGTQTYY